MSENNLLNPPKRLLHLDLLRLLAIYLVIFNHTGDRGYFLFVNSENSPLYFPYMMISVLCKIAVPLFFMISGALLLPKKESLRTLFSKRILRMAVVLFLISVPYYFWLKRAHGMGVSDFFTYIYGNSASTSLWYLYSYIGLLLMLPFLRSMVQNMHHKDYIYLMVGHIVLVGVLPCMERCLWNGNVSVHESFSPVIFVSQSVFYALMGYYLEHVYEAKNYGLRTACISIGVSLIAIIVTCFMTHPLVGNSAYSITEVEMYFNCFISVPAMTVYYSFKCLASKIQQLSIQKWLAILGSAVFGVYLIEKFVRSLTDHVYTLLSPIVGSMIASLIWVMIVLLIGLMIILPLKHIPIIKKIINKFI